MIELLLTYGKHPDDSSEKGSIALFFVYEFAFHPNNNKLETSSQFLLHVKLIDFYSSSRLDNPSDLTVE